jgi:hypothetical protein
MIYFSGCHAYFAPRQDKKDSKLSIVSIAQLTFGVEGDVSVVVGGLAMLPGPELAASGSKVDKLSASCGGAIVIVAINSEITATVTNVISACLLFSIN